MDNNPRSIAQGIATYLLLEDSCSFSQMGYYTKLMVDNLVHSHNKHQLNLIQLQDCLHDAENKLYEHDTKWDLISNKEEQIRISLVITQSLPNMINSSPLFLLAQNISVAILSNHNTELSKEYVHTLNKASKCLVAAHLIEGLDLEDLYSRFEPYNGSEIVYS